MSDAMDVLIQLDSLARRRRRLQASLDDVDAKLRARVVRGAELGLPKLKLAQRSTLSRETVYKVLRAAGIH